MRITSITIQNFQSFGPAATTIRLDDMTAFVGMNGVGKTAILQALVRLFGPSSERRLVRKDFHVPFGTEESSIEAADLVIEARIEFTEGEEGVAECFSQMAIEEVGYPPFCRVRLEGKWEKSAAVDGDIVEKAYWVTTPDETPDEEAKMAMSPSQRSYIQVTYVPATRDPAKQLRHVSGTVLHKLMQAVEWQETTKEAVKQACEDMSGAIVSEVGVATIQNSIGATWEKLYTSPVHSKVKLRAVTGEFGDLLKNIEAVFEPGESSAEAGIDRLSDGMKSLFYFCLIRAGFAIESSCRKGEKGCEGLAIDDLKLASLNIFVIEEPENHLSPHYLGRIMSELKQMATSAQVLVTSQSVGILKRVDPRDVRHVRLKAVEYTSIVSEISLPDEEDEGDAYKFVKEAVQAYPELYFSSFVILGEGDGEEIVIPRLAVARGINLDLGFVSMVPLGGRHVNHFWRLLNELKIPFVTLLDLDRERGGGGWARIKYVIDQLLLIKVDKSKLLALSNGKVMEDARLAKMPGWPLTTQDNINNLNSWADALEEHGVYFASPLDLDFLMYSSFPDAYQNTAENGPHIPSDATKLAARIQTAVVATLKSESSTGKTYTDEEKEAFIWYSYLFLGRGKPATHLKALNELEDAELNDNMPPVLERLLDHVGEFLDASTP